MTLHYSTWQANFTRQIFVRMNSRELVLAYKCWPVELVRINDRH